MNRQDLYQKFGPLLVEAVVLIIKDEINLVRAQLGLSERTNQQIIDVVSNKLETLSEYDWMQADI